MRKLTLILSMAALLCGHSACRAQIALYSQGVKASRFVLVEGKSTARICVDAKDAPVVARAAKLFAQDVQRVTGVALPVESSPGRSLARSLVVGTLGSNAIIDAWVAEGKLNVSQLRGKWECYLIAPVKTPGGEAIAVVGSDRRGTAFGLMSLSEVIGVSPWYWWADVPIKRSKSLVLSVNQTLSKEPSVKYRGVFINDEDWGLLRWSKRTYETEVGNIGPKTYAAVCELLLRLKANYLCPAMHEASFAFNRLPENKMVADTFAIVMGSVHCEPLLFNNASEWKKGSMGEWDYINNKEGINRVLSQRVQENAAYENVYTLALRGLHDKAMGGSNDMKERVKMLGSALADQRQIVADVLGRPADQIPQAFTPYKEVLDVYNNGLELPEDVTIIWPDDNYGYMKRLSSPAEQKRSGRSGVYYHASYLGKPHDYLWIASTPPALMYEELRKAYDATADRVWLLNAGDIKSCEAPVDLFLKMAYNIDAFSYDNIAQYQADWLASLFGAQYRGRFLDITTSYYHLAFIRKPEFMGFGYEWNTNKHARERVVDTDFSMVNYNEADKRLAEYERIANLTTQIMAEMNEADKTSLYHLLYYPVKGSELMNRMHLMAQRNRMYAHQGRAATNAIAQAVKESYDSLRLITAGYNALSGGKWNEIMSMGQGVTTSYFEQPKTQTLTAVGGPKLGLQLQNRDLSKGGYYLLPTFNPYTACNYWFELYNTGGEALSWSATPSADWIMLDRTTGTAWAQERVVVSVDWAKAPKGERVQGYVDLKTNGGDERILVSLFHPADLPVDSLRGLYVEDNGCISIGAAGFHRKRENDHITMRIVPNLGFENTAVQLGDPMAPLQNPSQNNVPALEYDFYSFQRGTVDVYTYTLPTFPLSSERGYAGHESTNVESVYGLCINDGPVLKPATSSFEYAKEWYQNVLRNCAIKKTTLYIDKPGKNTLKVLCGDAGVVVQKIVIDLGGMKRSYTGPEVTRVK